MADTNEAQLLSDLLRDIAREDARLDAPHLEARVMAAVEASSLARAVQPSFRTTRPYRWIAAAVAVAVLVPAMIWMKTEIPVKKVHLKVDATEEIVELTNAGRPAESDGPAKAGQNKLPQARHMARAAVTESAPIGPRISRAPITQLPVTPSPITQSLDVFVPLMPMTEQELTGPFQIVRVQMPRASLGALRSPLEHPNELVEADVLLGEDGMARAIRVSTSGSVYPWKSR